MRLGVPAMLTSLVRMTTVVLATLADADHCHASPMSPFEEPMPTTAAGELPWTCTSKPRSSQALRGNPKAAIMPATPSPFSGSSANFPQASAAGPIPSTTAAIALAEPSTPRSGLNVGFSGFPDDAFAAAIPSAGSTSSPPAKSSMLATPLFIFMLPFSSAACTAKVPRKLLVFPGKAGAAADIIVRMSLISELLGEATSADT
mmetsp:Transcript_58331/g.139038  ORF Transcript_58331/g.139038 Transcript_58331/m.139038 type:complete len:203 (+) Transcript_58331:179-787(+)